MASNKTKPWELNKSFIEEELIQQPIESFTLTQGSKIGDNVSGEILSIKVKTKKGEFINLIFKTFPQDPDQIAYVQDNRIFRIETAIYESVAPSLEKLLTQAGQPIKLPLPKLIRSYNDDSNDYLCLEDLRPYGYKMLDKHIGLGDIETRKILQEIARFHALTYHLIRYEGEKYFDSGIGEVKMLTTNVWSKHEPTWESIFMYFGGSIDVNIEFIEKVDQILAQRVKFACGDASSAGKIWKSTTMKTDDVYFPVIVHGDLWTNNVLFKYNNGVLDDIKFIDFQQSRRGNIYEDLSYFLLTSTTPKDRKILLGQWLDTYYDSFVTTLASVKCPLPINFSRGFFIDGIKNCFLAGYVYMHFAIPFQLGNFNPFEGEVIEPEEIREEPYTIQQVCISLHKKMKLWMERSELAQDRLVEITRELAEYGLI